MPTPTTDRKARRAAERAHARTCDAFQLFLFYLTDFPHIPTAELVETAAHWHRKAVR